MKNVIVPVFDAADLAALPNCLNFLGKSGTEVLLVLHNPSLGISGAEVTAEYDRRIEELEAAKRAAAGRDDFTAAQQYKEELDGVRMDREMALRDGWSKVDEAKRQEIYRRTFGDIGTEPVCLRENYGKEQVFQMLEALRATWPEDLPHGEFALVWPQSVPEPSVTERMKAPLSEPESARSESPDPLLTPRQYREKQLSASWTDIQKAARAHGISTAGKKKEGILAEILDKEFPAAA